MDVTRLESFDAILAELGVTDSTLSPAQKELLDRQGYFVATDVLDHATVALLRDAFERAYRGEHPPASESRRETGTRHSVALPDRDASFDVAFTHPLFLAAARHVLRRPFRVLQLGSRDPLPGFGRQGLHADWFRRDASEPFAVVTGIWMLDDFTPANGATRVVPGSHLGIALPPKSLAAPESRHPSQTLVTGRAASLLVMNGHLWHSGTRNDSRGPRRALQCQLVALDAVRRGFPPQNAPDRLGAAAGAVLVGLT